VRRVLALGRGKSRIQRSAKASHVSRPVGRVRNCQSASAFVAYFFVSNVPMWRFALVARS
jgi:hypothetical protein